MAQACLLAGLPADPLEADSSLVLFKSPRTEISQPPTHVKALAALGSDALLSTHRAS